MYDIYILVVVMVFGIAGGLYCISTDKDSVLWRLSNLAIRLSFIIPAFHFAIQQTVFSFLFGCFLALFAMSIPYDPLSGNNSLMPESNPDNQTQVIDLKELKVMKCIHKNTTVEAMQYTGENYSAIREKMLEVYGCIGNLNEECIRKNGEVVNKFLMAYGTNFDKMIKKDQYIVFGEAGIEVYTEEHFNETYDIVE